MTSVPAVTIGMPVFNGERDVAEAVGSLLAQTFRDFELVVCDNASTDRTLDVCRQVAARDGRVRVEAGETNIGQARNFDRALSFARGEFFLWAAHDDRWDPSYLERCLARFEADPSLVLVAARTAMVDTAGATVATDPGISTVGLPPAERFKRYKRTIDLPGHHSTITYGLHRRDALLEARPILPIIAWDHAINAQLCFLGTFDTLPETLFFKGLKPPGGFEIGARAMGITDPSKIAFTIFWREVAIQRVIARAGGLSPLARLRLRLWSWALFVRCNRWSGVRTWWRLRRARRGSTP